MSRGDIPQSLSRPEIKNYINELENYNQLSVEDKKLAKKPDAGSYRNSDVLVAFDRDFYSKCYLTEQKFANSWSLDIDHFKSKNFGQFPELKYDWSNLYPCSHDSNMFKPRIEPFGGYLDPCDINDDVEIEIIYKLNFGGVSNFSVSNSENIKAINTSSLLTKIHNGVDFNSKQKTANLRLLIAKKSEKVIKLIQEWLNEQNNEASKETNVLESKIKNILSRKSDFTMLLRSLASVKKYVPTSFLD